MVHLFGPKISIVAPILLLDALLFLSSDCLLHIPLIAAPILLSDGLLGLSLGLWKLLMVIFLLINCLSDRLPSADVSIT
jgi:hypothetical protein